VATAALPHALSLLLTALILDVVVAWVPGLRDALRAPAAATAGLAGWFDRRLNRERRAASTRISRGFVVIAAVAALGWFVGYALAQATTDPRGADVVTVAALLLLLSHRAPFDAARRAARNIGADDHTPARAAVTELADGFATGVVAVTFWYVLPELAGLGLPAVCAARAVHWAAVRIGPRGVFGRPAVALDAALGAFPAVIAAALIALAAIFAPRGHPFRAIRQALRTPEKPSVAAMAGALGFALGNGPWIGEGRARLVAQDVRTASYLYAVAALLHLGAVAAGFAAYSPI
jgi:adenosylcobinamide-phosphate synthase